MESIILPITHVPFDIYVLEEPPVSMGISNTKEGLRVVDHSNTHEIRLTTIELDHSAPCLGYSFYLKRNPKFIIEKAIENQVPREFWKGLQHGVALSQGGKLYTPDMVLGEERKGIRLSYVTDSRFIDGIVPFIKESDLFICEGTYGDDQDIEKAIENKHMTFGEAASLAKRGEVAQLLLTHFSQTMERPEDYKENATRIFNNITIGYDGWRKKLKFMTD